MPSSNKELEIQMNRITEAKAVASAACARARRTEVLVQDLEDIASAAQVLICLVWLRDKHGHGKNQQLVRTINGHTKALMQYSETGILPEGFLEKARL